MSWTRCVLTQARLTASVFTGCQFHEVVFDGCDLSAVSFVDCRFSDCVIRGGKCLTNLALVDSFLAGLTFADFSADAIEVQGGQLGELSMIGCDLRKLTFSGVSKPSRRVPSALTMRDTSLEAVGGISQLAADGVAVRVDLALWGLFGDLLLRQLGIQLLD